MDRGAGGGNGRRVDLRDAGVVVTGAGRGIGAALARRFAAAGARVVVNDRNPDRAATVAAEVGGLPLPGNAAESLVPAARRLLGGPVDVFCANAGAVHTGVLKPPTRTGRQPGTSTSWHTYGPPVTCCRSGWSAAVDGSCPWCPRLACSP
ncbi:hypothetical protein Jiend_53100 [Micromonospora endophytica]|uniref:SDR family NAD(P)-dependent oxidoreductase n=1 Tax=Micromonospora endophytica TaxID=515350 RepID=UPI001C33F759|nr:SDR family NAD(P)-dependent oxidoreductase [Micromonospora endophytica]BCJ61888.1 hypothetical protein Jiend_53100 [Micromonospora endophytica]